MKKIIYKLMNTAYRSVNKLFIEPGIKASFGSCGSNVKLSYDMDIRGNENIFMGSNIQIGPHALLWTTRAKLVFKDNILVGPGLTVITGDHRIDIKGRRIIDITNNEKLPEHDVDVIIEEDVWIGANVTILKGVTIGEGAVVAAGAVVTKNLEPYAICAGVPCKKIKERFTEEGIEEHKRLLKEKCHEEDMHDSSR